jgi:hypothetical protein
VPFPVASICVLFAVFGRRHGVLLAAGFWRLATDSAAVSPPDGRRRPHLTFE